MANDAHQLPGRPLSSGDLTVRPWRPEDAESLREAVTVSREHLLPWMPWAAEPTPTLEQQRERIARWERERLEGGDCVCGIFVGARVAGGCGLHRRLGPEGLEIGYWLHVDFGGRGLMTVAAGLLTDAAFTLPGIEVIEIHHDKANERSAGVPRRLGFTLVREVIREPQAPAETGVELHWRLTRDEWTAGGGSREPPGSGSLETGRVQHLIEGSQIRR